MEIKDLTNQLPVHESKRYKTRDLSLIKYLVVHHSATSSGSAKAYANYHVETKGWAGIGYHFVIDKDGTVNRTNPDWISSYHVGESNGYSLGICMTGNFTKEEPTEKQYASLLELLRELKKQYPHAEIKGHQEMPTYSWKPCPSIDMNKCRQDVETMEKPVSDWAKKEVGYAVKHGITDGSRPQDLARRQEMMIMAGRVHEELIGYIKAIHEELEELRKKVDKK